MYLRIGGGKKVNDTKEKQIQQSLWARLVTGITNHKLESDNIDLQ